MSFTYDNMRKMYAQSQKHASSFDTQMQRIEEDRELADHPEPELHTVHPTVTAINLFIDELVNNFQLGDYSDIKTDEMRKLIGMLRDYGHQIELDQLETYSAMLKQITYQFEVIEADGMNTGKILNILKVYEMIKGLIESYHLDDRERVTFMDRVIRKISKVDAKKVEKAAPKTAKAKKEVKELNQKQKTRQRNTEKRLQEMIKKHGIHSDYVKKFSEDFMELRQVFIQKGKNGMTKTAYNQMMSTEKEMFGVYSEMSDEARSAATQKRRIAPQKSPTKVRKGENNSKYIEDIQPLQLEFHED